MSTYPCRKCGSYKVAAVYHGGLKNLLPRVLAFCFDAREHLHYFCEACGYSWKRQP